MARKIIKAILFILAAVVVAGGIMTYLRSQKKITAPIAETPKTEAPKPQTSQIGEVVVSTQSPSSVQVQIQGIKEKNFNISNLPTGDGFKITVPHAQLAQAQKLLDKPHPLIKKIEVHESAEDPTTAEIIFYTEKNVNFLDTQKNDTLTIDFVKTDAAPEPAKVVETPAPKASTKSSAATKASSKKARAAVSKKSSKLSKSSSKKSKSKSSSNIKLKPFDPSMVEDSDLDAQTETLVPQESAGAEAKADRSMDLSAFGTSTPSTENIPLGQEEIPTIEPDSGLKPSDDDNDGFNLNEVVKEEPKVPAGSANLLDAETEMSLKEGMGGSGQVAAVPQNQKFDMNKLQNLPAIQNVTVQRSGTSTVVTFDREKPVPYKIFRMVNPSRIVVDFKDTKNSLKSDYPRFAGTKISRIESRAYAGADGMLVRVIMYVDGAPNYTSEKKGNQLVLELK